MSPEDGKSHLAIMRGSLKRIRSLLNRASAKQVEARSIIDSSKDFVRQYFNAVRPIFQSNGLDNESLGGLDHWTQQLLTLSQKSSLRSKYNRIIKSIDRELNGVEVALVTATTEPSILASMKLDGREQRIAVMIQTELDIS